MLAETFRFLSSHQSTLFDQQWKSSPSPSQLSSRPQSSPGWSLAIGTSEPKNTVTRSPRGRSKQVGRITEDPTLHEYHTYKQNTDQYTETERKTMPTKSSKTKFKENMRASLPVQSMGRGACQKPMELTFS